MPNLASPFRRVDVLACLLLVSVIVLYAAYGGVTSEGLKRTQLWLALARATSPLVFGAVVLGLWKLASLYRPATTERVLPWLALIGGWAWCLLAGGGGLGILLIRGPWPPTNGWFALISGLVACPLLGRLLRRAGGLRVSGWRQFGAAVLLISLGRLALTVWPQPHPL